jgi:DtxR family Mn-dependent transcriptional regulator
VLNITEPLSASLEDYLEAIFHIEEQKHAARGKDIAERLSVSGASVTAALRTLSGKKLINYAPYDLITLTSKGKAIAEDIVQRHTILQDFFVRVLGIDDKTADEAACKIEHDIPGAVVDRLTQFIEFLESCPRGGREWLEEFGEYCEHGKKHTECETCLANLIENFKAS